MREPVSAERLNGLVQTPGCCSSTKRLVSNTSKDYRRPPETTSRPSPGPCDFGTSKTIWGVTNHPPPTATSAASTTLCLPVFNCRVHSGGGGFSEHHGDPAASGFGSKEPSVLEGSAGCHTLERAEHPSSQTGNRNCCESVPLQCPPYSLWGVKMVLQGQQISPGNKLTSERWQK